MTESNIAFLKSVEKNKKKYMIKKRVEVQELIKDYQEVDLSDKTRN